MSRKDLTVDSLYVSGYSSVPQHLALKAHRFQETANVSRKIHYTTMTTQFRKGSLPKCSSFSCLLSRFIPFESSCAQNLECVWIKD